MKPEKEAAILRKLLDCHVPASVVLPGGEREDLTPDEMAWASALLRESPLARMVVGFAGMLEDEQYSAMQDEGRNERSKLWALAAVTKQRREVLEHAESLLMEAAQAVELPPWFELMDLLDPGDEP